MIIDPNSPSWRERMEYEIRQVIINSGGVIPIQTDSSWKARIEELLKILTYLIISGGDGGGTAANDSITNLQIAANAAIAWSKLSKVGAVAGDVGAATAAQGALASTALQPGAAISTISGLQAALNALTSAVAANTAQIATLTPIVLSVAPVTRDISRLDNLLYSATNIADYTYYQDSGLTFGMQSLYNGNTNFQMAVYASKVFVKVQLAAVGFLNRLDFSNADEGGGFFYAQTIKVYAGDVSSDAGAPLYSASLQANTTIQQLDLTAKNGFDTPGATYTIVLARSSGNLSMNKITFKGYAA